MYPIKSHWRRWYADIPQSPSSFKKPIDCSTRRLSYWKWPITTLRKLIAFVDHLAVSGAFLRSLHQAPRPRQSLTASPEPHWDETNLSKIYKKNSITCLSPITISHYTKRQPSRPILSVAKPETSDDPARFKPVHIPVEHATQPPSHSRIPIFFQNRDLRNAIFRDVPLHFL
jgi:hypothetical protein